MGMFENTPRDPNTILNTTGTTPSVLSNAMNTWPEVIPVTHPWDENGVRFSGFADGIDYKENVATEPIAKGIIRAERLQRGD